MPKRTAALALEQPQLITKFDISNAAPLFIQIAHSQRALLLLSSSAFLLFFSSLDLTPLNKLPVSRSPLRTFDHHTQRIDPCCRLLIVAVEVTCSQTQHNPLLTPVQGTNREQNLNTVDDNADSSGCERTDSA